MANKNIESAANVQKIQDSTSAYGFVTFETEDEADKVLKQAERFILKDKKLNIAPAVKKQPYSRTLESSTVANASLIWPSQPSSRTSAGYARDSMYYPQTPWPLMWPQFCLQQQCPYPSIPQAGFPQYVYPIAPVDYPYQPVSGSDFSETSSADSGESVKNRTKPAASTLISSDYDRGRSARAKPADTQNSNMPKYNGGSADNSNCLHSVPHHPVFAKTLNGLTVMSYPSSMVMGTQAIVYVKDGNESDNMLTELGFLHSPITSGTLTPPTTPLVSFPCDFGANTTLDSIRKN